MALSIQLAYWDKIQCDGFVNPVGVLDKIQGDGFVNPVGILGNSSK
jgi:hypothetical protein